MNVVTCFTVLEVYVLLFWFKKKYEMKQEATHVFVIYSHSRIAANINWKVKPNLAVKPAWLATV